MKGRELLITLATLILGIGLMVDPSLTFAQSAPGPGVCKNCHLDKYESYQGSVHGQKGNKRGPANAGECSTCHGDGTEHVKAGGGRGGGGIIKPRAKWLAPEGKGAV